MTQSCSTYCEIRLTCIIPRRKKSVYSSAHRLELMAKPNLFQRIWIAATNPNAVRRNSVGENLLNVPLFNRTNVLDNKDFGEILLSDKDLYRGYLYAAIKKRANRVAQMATENVKTRLNDNDDAPNHPYLEVIDKSKTFSNHFFWKALSTFVDLEGSSYLLVLRNFNETRFGEPQEFKLLNPYNLTKVVNSQGELGGYIEQIGSRQRELPLQMVIRINSLNPWNLDEGFAMSDAAKDSQYTSQQSGSFTRQALKRNLGQRGLITSEIVMDDAQFDNFKARVRASGGIENAGDFLFGNGPGAINYTDMQIDLDKWALDKIKEMSTQELMVVAGVSKTILGIEVSGTTRETGKVQSDLFDSNEIIPQLQTLIDGLNQDYKNSYPDLYEKTPQNIYIDSPLKRDREAEKADAETLKIKAEAAQVLINTGFEPTEVLEQVGLEEMTFEKPEPQVPQDQPTDDEDEDSQQEHIHDHVDWNATGPNDSLAAVIKSKETSLQNSVVNIQGKLLQAILDRVNQNDLTPGQEEKIISKSDKRSLIKELEVVLADFGNSTVSLFAMRNLRKRLEQFGLTAIFNLSKKVKDIIKVHATKSATSHIESVLEEVYKKAQELAEANLSRSENAAQLSKLFNDKITQTRATRIARTESNRMWTESQYQSDTQFIEQNGLETQAFKRWVVRSDNPCAYCLALQAETASKPIPFFDPFRAVGESVDVAEEGKQRSYVVGYEPITAGTLHPNCSCIYEIVIIRE